MKKLFFILMLGCAACTTQARDPQHHSGSQVKSGAAPGADLLTQIRAQTADAACSDNGQCRSLPLGAMACGGPEDYLAYSILRTDEKKVRELAERYKAERKAQIVKRGEMSICRHVPDPGATCVSGTCRLGAAAEAR